ncbi:uncharacterized protein CEXT_648871 [Caerostris extrusa]|uniref:Uncharacterized protein n=1 Tax=Caerostris extrusa TaxID=172846 RepID=A0AAV4WFB6_CAEEX|nr:uncharacterized protein CEXT_648871 [Caerostris extrusa]
MNRRQYIKPYYNPTGGLSYAPSEYGAKPMFGGANGYKAISVPLRQLQKYYKPYYAAGEGGSPQYMQSPAGSAPGSCRCQLFCKLQPQCWWSWFEQWIVAPARVPARATSLVVAAALRVPVPYTAPVHQPAAVDCSSRWQSIEWTILFGQWTNSGTLAVLEDPGNLPAVMAPCTTDPVEVQAAVCTGSSGSSANGPVFSVDGGSSGGLGSNGGNYGDLYASGASPSAALYNPSNGDNGRNYGNSNNKQPSYTGAGSSALYISSSDDRSSESYPSSKSSNEHANSFNVDSARNSETYSVSFQPAQSKNPTVDSNQCPIRPTPETRKDFREELFLK